MLLKAISSIITICFGKIFGQATLSIVCNEFVWMAYLIQQFWCSFKWLLLGQGRARA